MNGNGNSGFELAPFEKCNAACVRKYSDAILECNRTTAQYGLELSAEAAAAVAENQARAINAAGRIEFGQGIAAPIIKAFCDSPYISRQDYEQTLCELIELFYDFKNQTCDAVGDAALVEYMKKAFDGECAGSTEILAETSLPKLVKKLNARRAAGGLKFSEGTDD